VIGKFYIGECYCILHALGKEKENLAVFNLADFHNSPNCQNKFYAKFSSYTVFEYNFNYLNIYFKGDIFDSMWTTCKKKFLKSLILHKQP